MDQFDDRRCSRTDQRYLLFLELSKAHSNDPFDEEAIRELASKYPMIFRCKYRLPYEVPAAAAAAAADKNPPSIPTPQQNDIMIYTTPLARLAAIQSVSLDLLELVYELCTEAIREPDDEEGDHAEGKHGSRLPLHYACRYGLTETKAIWLLEKYPDAIRRKSDRGVLPFFYAVGNSSFSLEAIRRLHELYPNGIQMCTCYMHWYPIHSACEFQTNVDILLYLINQAPHVCCEKVGTGATALHQLCSYHPSLEVIKALVQAYPDGPKEVDRDGYMPLHRLLSYTQEEVPLSLLGYVVQCYPNAVKHKTQNGKMNLPLHLACASHASIYIVSLLLKVYPDAIHLKTPGDVSTIDFAKEMGAPYNVIAFLSSFSNEYGTMTSIANECERNNFIDNLVHQALKQTVAEEDSGIVSSWKAGTTRTSPNSHSNELNDATGGRRSVQNSASATVAWKCDRRYQIQSNTYSADDTDNVEWRPGAIRVRGIGRTNSSSSIDAAIEEQVSQRSQQEANDNEGLQLLQGRTTSRVSTTLSPTTTTTVIAAEVAPDIVEMEKELQSLRETVATQKQQLQGEEELSMQEQQGQQQQQPEEIVTNVVHVTGRVNVTTIEEDTPMVVDRHQASCCLVL